MARRYFGTDGIRGLANGDKLTPELAMKVGMGLSLATWGENATILLTPFHPRFRRADRSGVGGRGR